MSTLVEQELFLLGDIVALEIMWRMGWTEKDERSTRKPRVRERAVDFSGLVDRLKEMVPKPRPEVNLSFDEYVDVLYGIVEQCAEDVCQEDEACALSGNDVATASAHKREIGVWQVVLLSAMKLWNSSGRFKDKTKVAIENEMISRVASGQGLSGDEAEVEARTLMRRRGLPKVTSRERCLTSSDMPCRLLRLACCAFGRLRRCGGCSQRCNGVVPRCAFWIWSVWWSTWPSLRWWMATPRS